MNRRVILCVSIALAALGSALVGCPQNLGGAVAGTTTEAQKNTFTEREFALDASLAARLEHIIAVHLEAAGTHPNDTGSEDGVDEIPYVLKKATMLSLAIPLNEGHGHWIEWCDAGGHPMLTARGTVASSRTRIPAGRYMVRVHHTNAHDRMETMFLRSTATKQSTLTSQDRREYFPGYEEGLDDVFCVNENNSGTGSIFAPEEEDRSVFITGNLSCANIVGADFSTYFGEGEGDFDGLAILFFNNNPRNALFTNCKFNDSIMNGTLADSMFVGCSFVNTEWQEFKLTGTTTFQNCSLTNDRPLSLNAPGSVLTNCNLSGTNLGKSQLTGSTFRSCNFSGSNFDGAVFDQCQTLFAPASGDSFTGAKFAGVSVQHINFQGVNLTGLATDWSRANFSSADLTSQTLTTCNFTSAVFANTILNKVICTANQTLGSLNFAGAAMEESNFSGSNFSHATLDRIGGTAGNFSGCIFDGVSGHGADFAYSNCSNARFAGAQLGSAADSSLQPAAFTYAYMPNAQITDSADFRNVDFSHAHLYGANASVQGAELTAANFTSAIVSGMDFSGATLESASFENAQAVATKFVGAKVNDAKFDGAYLMGADFTNASATSAIFADAATSSAPCNNNPGCQSCKTASCTFAELNLADLCCYSFSEPDGTVYAVSFEATILPNDTSIICPNGEFGPCTGAKLTPRGTGPFPAVPPCIPSPLNWCPQPVR